MGARKSAWVLWAGILVVAGASEAGAFKAVIKAGPAVRPSGAASAARAAVHNPATVGLAPFKITLSLPSSVISFPQTPVLIQGSGAAAPAAASVAAAPAAASVAAAPAAASVVAAEPGAPNYLRNSPAAPSRFASRVSRTVEPVKRLIAAMPAGGVQNMSGSGSAGFGRRLMSRVLGMRPQPHRAALAPVSAGRARGPLRSGLQPSRKGANQGVINDDAGSFFDNPPGGELSNEKPEYYRRFVYKLRFMRDDRSFTTADAFRVQDEKNAKGGTRWSLRVGLELISKLAREMTRKLRVLKVPLGGGKGGIAVDPATLSPKEQARLMRTYVRHLYLGGALGVGVDSPAPDVGTGEEHMAVFMDEYLRQWLKEDRSVRQRYPGLVALLGQVARHPEKTLVLDKFMKLARTKNGVEPEHLKLLSIVTGKPVGKGGIPGRSEATGRGVMITAREAWNRYFSKPLGKAFGQASAIIQGAGNVGIWAAKTMFDQGVAIRAVSDRYGMIYNKKGLDIDALMIHYREHKTLDGFSGGTFSSDPDALFDIEADIFSPSAIDDTITPEVARRLKVKLIVEGANFPTTDGGDVVLNERGVIVVPDVLANVNGVGVSYMEMLMALDAAERGIWAEWDIDEVRARSEKALIRRFLVVVEEAEKHGITLREAAHRVAE